MLAATQARLQPGARDVQARAMAWGLCAGAHETRPPRLGRPTNSGRVGGVVSREVSEEIEFIRQASAGLKFTVRACVSAAAMTGVSPLGLAQDGDSVEAPYCESHPRMPVVAWHEWAAHRPGSWQPSMATNIHLRSRWSPRLRSTWT